jgi:hypothetical protein
MSYKPRTAGGHDMSSEPPSRLAPALANARPSNQRISADICDRSVVLLRVLNCLFTCKVSVDYL